MDQAVADVAGTDLVRLSENKSVSISSSGHHLVVESWPISRRTKMTNLFSKEIEFNVQV